MRRRWTSGAAAGILLLCIAAPLAAQGIPLPRVAIFFTARQGRWTLLTSWTLVFATQNRTGLALDAAEHALRLADRASDDRKSATSLHYLAVVYGAAGDDRRAEACIRRALAIRERTLGGGDPAVADELIQLARILMRQRRFETAGALLERALAIRQRNPDAPGPVVDATADQAELLSAQRRFTESEQTYRRALTLADERLTPDDPALATVVAGLATVLRETGRAAEAVALYRRAIDLSSAVMGESDPALVPVLRQQAAAYDQLGRAEEARGARALAEGILARVLGNDRSAAVQKRWEKLVAESITLFGQQEYGALVHNGRTAVEMAEALFGPNDYRVSVFLVLLGAQTGSGEGDYAHAEALFRRAVRIAERAVGTEDAGLAEALLNFARLYSQELKEQPAETMLLRAISIHERVMGLQTSEDPLMHSPRINLALLYAQQGRLDEAESLLQHALAIVENGNGPKAPRQFATSQLLIALADLRERQRRYAEAEPLIRRAVDLASTTWGLGWGKVKNATIAGGLSDLAFVHVQEGRLADAERTYARVMALQQKTGGRGGDLSTRGTLAWLFARQGRQDAAIAMSTDALARAGRLRLPWHVHDGALSLAAMHLDQGRYREAEPLIRKALVIEQDAVAADSPRRGATLFTLATAVAGAGRSSEAESLYAQSFANLQRQAQFFFTYMSESDRLQVLAGLAQRVASYFSFVDRVHQDDPEMAGRMYDLVLWDKGLVVRSIEALRRRVARAGDRHALALLDELAARRAQLAAAMSEPALGAAAGASRARVAHLQQQANDVERRLVAGSRAFLEDREQQTATWEDVRRRLAALGADAAVEFVRFAAYDGAKPTGDFRYVALVVTAGSPRPVLVRLGDAASLETTSVGAYLQTVTRGDRSVSLATAGESFYDVFWKPIEPAIAGARRVYVAPDGVLNQMAFGLTAMPDGRLLMDAYDLRIVNSTADLLRERHAAEGRSAVLVGNPRFLLEPAERDAAVASLLNPASPATATLSPLQRDAALGQSRGASEGTGCLAGDLAPLDHTQLEVDEIAARLRAAGWDPEPPYTGARALEEAVKRVRHPRVLHLATHGFFCADTQPVGEDPPSTPQDPMLHSGLLFAGSQTTMARAQAGSSADDGILTAYEASLLDLQGTELVVLSACNTGLGEYRAGEGVFGLRRALQEAGAGAVLMSMWPVPDSETHQLMTFFYDHWLGGEDKHDALRHAQRDLRAVLRHQNNDRPFLWGAFVLVGP